jgi:hypothetical protein
MNLLPSPKFTKIPIYKKRDRLRAYSELSLGLKNIYFQLSVLVVTNFFANLIVLTGSLAFVLRKSMQTGKEPVKVALRLAFRSTLTEP